jgi:predicted DsbA family dithiol-disulfide isomerase
VDGYLSVYVVRLKATTWSTPRAICFEIFRNIRNNELVRWLMTGAVERGLSVLLSISAVTIAGSVAWREFGKPRPNETSPAGRPLPEYISGWEKALAVGIRIGEASARVTVVEFTDLECPACRRFQGVMREILREYPRDVALIFVHRPVPGHHFAMQAARAAECAERIGRFLPMIEAIFGNQDSLGIKSWGSLALEAGITDSASISTCARDARPVDRINAGVALAERLEVQATPTVFVNGWKYLGPTKGEMDRAIEAALQGKAPRDVRVD